MLATNCEIDTAKDRKPIWDWRLSCPALLYSTTYCPIHSRIYWSASYLLVDNTLRVNTTLPITQSLFLADCESLSIEEYFVYKLLN